MSFSSDLRLPSGVDYNLQWKSQNSPQGNIEPCISVPLEQVAEKAPITVEWEGLIEKEKPIAYHSHLYDQQARGTTTTIPRIEKLPESNSKGTSSVRSEAEMVSKDAATSTLELVSKDAATKTLATAAAPQNTRSFDDNWGGYEDNLRVDGSLWRADTSFSSRSQTSSKSTSNERSEKERVVRRETQRRQLRELRMSQGVNRKQSCVRKASVPGSPLSNVGSSVLLSDRNESLFDSNRIGSQLERKVCLCNTGTYRSKEWGAGGGGKPEPLGNKMHAGTQAVSSEAPTWMTSIREEYGPSTLMHHKNADLQFEVRNFPLLGSGYEGINGVILTNRSVSNDLPEWMKRHREETNPESVINRHVKSHNFHTRPAGVLKPENFVKTQTALLESGDAPQWIVAQNKRIHPDLVVEPQLGHRQWVNAAAPKSFHPFPKPHTSNLRGITHKDRGHLGAIVQRKDIEHKPIGVRRDTRIDGPQEVPYYNYLG